MKSTLLLFLAISWISLAGPAFAGVVIVDPTGFGDAETIQAGINLASSGDTVYVAATTYTGEGNRDISFSDMNIHLISLGGCGTTIIDCDGLGRGMVFAGGQDTTCVVEGIAVRNAAADTGAGVICLNGSSPKFVACLFAGNTAVKFGGGVFAEDASPVFVGCDFELNEATGTAGRAYGYGGGFSCFGACSSRFEGCGFVANEAASVGGGVHLGGNTNPSLFGCEFTGNTTSGSGGGAAFAGPNANATFSGCAFTSNEAPAGGAMYTQSSSVVVTGCSFAGNSASYVGSAIYLLYPSTPTVEHSTFFGNAGNACGAAVAAAQSDVLLSHCTFWGNTAMVGAGTLSFENASPTVTNTIIARSSADHAVSCLGTGVPSFQYCVLFENENGDGLCGSVADTMVRDPLFCNVQDDDFTLCSNSPCLDSGNAWGQAVGALGEGCGPCDSPIQPSTWGRVKGLYR